MFSSGAVRFLPALLSGALLFAAVVPAGAASVTEQPKPDPRFGLNQAWENGAAADTAGAGWSRLTFWWSAFEPNGPLPASSGSDAPKPITKDNPNGWNYF